MSKKMNERIHALLDGEAPPSGDKPEEEAILTPYRDALKRLQARKVSAPFGLTTRIMAALPTAGRFSFREWLEEFLPARRQWAAPALAGALLMLAVMLGVRFWTPSPGAPRMLVHFQIHAPGAERVELVGDFNNWTPGAIQLRGPDASGHWTTDVELPEGRYEYQFLVNGSTWVTDPNAAAHRPDGFGRENAVRDVYEGGS